MKPARPGYVAKPMEDMVDVSLLRSTPAGLCIRPALQAFSEHYTPCAHLDLGNLCNLACPYCGLSRESDTYTPPRTALALVDRIASAGLGTLALVGGEPTIRKDLGALIERARERGIDQVVLTTNGQLLSYPEVLAELVDHGLGAVHLSLDAADPEHLSQVLGAPQAGARALAALDNLAARPELYLFLYAVVTRANVSALGALCDRLARASEQRGAPLPLILTAPKPTGRAWTNRAQLLLPPPEVAAAVAAAAARADGLGIPLFHRNLPACLVSGLEGRSIDAVIREGRLDLHRGRILLDERPDGHQLGPDCSGCAAAHDCSGVHEHTIATFGWAPYRPVLRPPEEGDVSCDLAFSQPAPERSEMSKRPPEARDVSCDLAFSQPAPERSEMSKIETPSRGNPPSPPPRAVIVGGRGFLGAAVRQLLAEGGWEVTTVGRSAPATGASTPGRALIVDAGQPDALAAVLPREIDLWIDLAIFSAADMGARLDAWKSHPPRRILVAGSVAEYGLDRALPDPLTEGSERLPEDDYGRGKRDAQALLEREASSRGLAASWAVLPQLWGPGDPSGRVQGLIDALLAGAPIAMNRGGRNHMPDGYVGHAAAALLALAAAQTSPAQRVFVCGPEDVSPARFVALAAGAIGRDALVTTPGDRAQPVPGGGVPPAERRPAFPGRDLRLSRALGNRLGLLHAWSASVGVVATARWHAAQTGRRGGEG